MPGVLTQLPRQPKQLLRGQVSVPRSALTRITPESVSLDGLTRFWYDPSDAATCFQEPYGLTPAGDGAVVGLMLDKSQGLLLGPELVTNGSFTTDTDWTKGVGWAITGGKAVATAAQFPQGVVQTLALVDGGWYRVTFDVERTLGDISVGVGGGGGSIASPPLAASGSYAFYMRADTVGGAFSDLYARCAGAAFSGTIDNISCKRVYGNHLYQSTAAQKPLRTLSGGLWSLLWDGVDDGMVTSSFAWGSDEASVVAGLRKLSDAAIGTPVEFSADIQTNNGAWVMTAPATNGGASVGFYSKGTTLRQPSGAGLAAPISLVTTGLSKIGSDTISVRASRAVVATATADQGTGDYLTYPVYVGRRGGTTRPFSGHIYGLIGRSKLADGVTLRELEHYMGLKSGVPL